MSLRTVAAVGSGRLERLRANAARHQHAALLAAVVVTLATEPAVQAGRDPYTVHGAWQLASAVMLGLAIGLLAWLVARAAAATAEAAPT